jgi:YD repeat-containing protein
MARHNPAPASALTYTPAGRIIEEFRPRIGGAATEGPEKAAEPSSA